MGTLHSLANALYVWEPNAALSNSTLLTGTDGTLCVDLQARPAMAAQMLDEVRPVVGEVSRAVITHHHADHVFGAEAFPGAAVVSTANTNTLLLERAERERQRLLEALPDHAFEIARAAPPVPRRVIDTAEWLDLGGCGAELIPVGHAHTPGDLVVFEPETRTLITGDVVFNGPFPVLRDADSLGWIAALEFVLGLEPEHVVPGHGPVGDRSCIKRMRDLLELLRSTVAGLLDAGLEGEALINAVSLPERFDDLTRRERIRPAVAQIECEIAGQMRKVDGGKEGHGS